MKSLDIYREENDSLPEIGCEASLAHPLHGEQVQGTITTYTCSHGFGHVDGVYVMLEDGHVVDCRLCDVEVC